MIKYAIWDEIEVAVATKCNIQCIMMHQLYGDTDSDIAAKNTKNYKIKIDNL